MQIIFQKYFFFCSIFQICQATLKSSFGINEREGEKERDRERKREIENTNKHTEKGKWIPMLLKGETNAMLHY